MEGHIKVFAGYLLPTITGLLYFGAKKEDLMLIIFASLVLLGFYLVIFGMIEFGKDLHKIATKLRDGDYRINGSPVVEIRIGKGSFKYFEDIDNFDLQKAINVIAVHLWLEPAYYGGSMRHYIISSEKIPARLWSMILSGSIIEISNGFVRDICMPDK